MSQSETDSQQLQTLFDQTVAQRSSASQAGGSQRAPQDSQELEALFEASRVHQPLLGAESEEPLHERLGSLVRKLHDALGQLGKSDLFDTAAEHLPADRERLSFINGLMEKSASKVLGLAEAQMPALEEQERLTREASKNWALFLDGKLSLEQFKSSARELPALLHANAERMSQARASFLEVILAQDFQDLAGQTLAKVINHVTAMESDLLELLAFTAQEPERKERIEEFLAGPSFTKNAGPDVATSQSEVDDLLRDLGF